jgi:uncharacterized membrane protein YkoI
MKRFLVMAFASLVVPTALAHANSKPAKLAHEKVDLPLARAAAVARVPNGTLTSHELVHDHDRLRYSFWFIEPGKSGFKEVSVDAASGKVVKVKHESIEGMEQARAKGAKPHH